MPKKSTKLTPKQQTFVAEYVANKGNATQAAIAAGHPKKTARSIGAENLTKPHIMQAIQKQMAKHLDKADITAERVIEELGRLAFSNIEDFTSIDANGQPHLDLSNATRDQMAAIQEVSEAGEKTGAKIKTASKQAALNTLASHFGLLQDQGPSVGDVTIQIAFVGAKDD